MSAPKITVVGSFLVDVAAYAPRFPVDGETVICDYMKLGPGGKGSNQATAANRAGGDVTMITKIGTDPMAEICLGHYRKEGMRTDCIFTSATKPTGIALIEINRQGQNRILIDLGANEDLTDQEIEAAENIIAKSDILLLQNETTVECNIKSIEIARRHHVPIVYNTAPIRPLPDGLLQGIDFITPNETEASYYSGISVTDIQSAGAAAKKLLEYGVCNVIITLGKEGALWCNHEHCVHIPTLSDIEAVDTTGAGDAFNGNLCVALAEGKNIFEACKFANCAASISVTRKGTAPAMPIREESMEAYLNSNIRSNSLH